MGDGYDLYPVETVEAKKKLIPQAANENWTCLFYHDPELALGRIEEVGGKFRVVESDNGTQNPLTNSQWPF